jgi:Domain of unknown function (DUF4386)
VAARLIGVLYLAQMAIAIFGQSFVRDQLVVRGDATRTAQNIMGAERLFRLSIAGDLLTYSTVIILIWALYIVLRPIDRNLAFLAVLFRLAENAVLCLATVSSLVVLKLLSGSASFKAFETGQLHSLAALALSAQGLGMNVAFILLGLGSTVFSYLWLKSRYIPRALAGWGIFASSLLAVGTLAIIVFPSLGAVGLTYMVPMFFYEVGLGLWLLIKGLRAPLLHGSTMSAPNE